MTGNGGTPDGLDFTVDKNNLYREVTITDLRTANLQKLIPIKADGTDDDTRDIIYIGRTQLNTPQGPVPIQAKLAAATLDEAMDLFPGAMEVETQKVVETIKRLQAQQKKQQDSRIIVPGMQ